MSQLSRKERYSQLREKLDEDTTASAADSSLYIGPYGNINTTAAHAAKTMHSAKAPVAKAQMRQLPKSEVMTDLLGEVKQYNIDNGDRLEDDTQINILRTLENSSEQLRRSRHIVPMEEEDKSGSTMRIQKKSGAAGSTGQKLTRMNPVRTSEESKLVLSEEDLYIGSNEILADDPADMDSLNILGFDKPAKEEPEPKVQEQPKSPFSFFKRKNRPAPVEYEEEEEEEAEIPAPPISRRARKQAQAEESVQPEQQPVQEESRPVQEETGGLSILFDEPFSMEEDQKAKEINQQKQEEEQEEKVHHFAMDGQNILIAVLVILLLASLITTVFILIKSGIL